MSQQPSAAMGSNGKVLRTAVVYMVTGFLVFLLMGLLGILMRVQHAGLAPWAAHQVRMREVESFGVVSQTITATGRQVGGAGGMTVRPRRSSRSTRRRLRRHTLQVHHVPAADRPAGTKFSVGSVRHEECNRQRLVGREPGGRRVGRDQRPGELQLPLSSVKPRDVLDLRTAVPWREAQETPG